MTPLADDPTSLALLAEVPCYPVPPIGQSPAIEALRNAHAGMGLAIGCDGVMLILRRAWLAADILATELLTTQLPLPYGSVGRAKADLRCGLIPNALLTDAIDHFRRAMPDEAAAFVVWNEISNSFTLNFPTIREATPSRLIYEPPILDHGSHIVCDMHSHGASPAYFSPTDDRDDTGSTKIAMVIGRLDHPDGLDTALRLCAAGMFLPIDHSPFAGVHHAG